jgi:hypothetical protein
MTLALIGGVVLSGLVVAAAELLGAHYDPAARMPAYVGGAAGLAAAGLGLIFALKLARLDLSKDTDGAFWKWWGGGMLARFFLIGALGLILSRVFEKQAAAALLTMMAVYLMGLFAETAWLAQIFFNAGKK